MPDQKAAADSSSVVVGPPTHSASHFITSTSANEVLLTFGTTRIGFNPAGQSGHVVDWFMSVALPPAVAKQLVKSVTEAFAAAEKPAGKAS